jgi:hypothetical protein
VRSWLRGLTRLGAHSRRMAAWSVWEVLLASPPSDTGWLPRPPGQHRLGVAPGTAEQRRAWGLATS